MMQQELLKKNRGVPMQNSSIYVYLSYEYFPIISKNIEYYIEYLHIIFQRGMTALHSQGMVCLDSVGGIQALTRQVFQAYSLLGPGKATHLLTLFQMVQKYLPCQFRCSCEHQIT